MTKKRLLLGLMSAGLMLIAAGPAKAVKAQLGGINVDTSRGDPEVDVSGGYGADAHADVNDDHDLEFDMPDYEVKISDAYDRGVGIADEAEDLADSF